MKQGAGDDLLSDVGDDDPEPDDGDDRVELTASAAEHEPIETDQPPQESAADEIPYLLRRNRVKEERKTIGFGLQKETRARENDVLQEMKNELDIETLPATDLREAAYLAGLDDTDRIKEILLNWGYEHRR